MLDITIKNTDTDSTETFECDLMVADFATIKSDGFSSSISIIGKGNKHIIKTMLRELKTAIRRHV